LQVYLYRTDGSLVNILVNTLKKGQDTTYVYESGKFYLTINATEEWKIIVEEKR